MCAINIVTYIYTAVFRAARVRLKVRADVAHVAAYTTTFFRCFYPLAKWLLPSGSVALRVCADGSEASAYTLKIQNHRIVAIFHFKKRLNMPKNPYTFYKYPFELTFKMQKNITKMFSECYILSITLVWKVVHLQTIMLL